MKTRLAVILISALFTLSCVDEPEESPCVQGKYLGEYCEGVIVQILDESTIGSDLSSMFGDEMYANSVVVSMDTLLTKNIESSIFASDSAFYFNYTEGGYPRKQFNICEPSASITITHVSKQPCVDHKQAE
jgi:hypothetical protein